MEIIPVTMRFVETIKNVAAVSYGVIEKEGSVRLTWLTMLMAEEKRRTKEEKRM
jgi:hypothetical protein